MLVPRGTEGAIPLKHERSSCKRCFGGIDRPSHQHLLLHDGAKTASSPAPESSLHEPEFYELSPCPLNSVASDHSHTAACEGAYAPRQFRRGRRVSDGPAEILDHYFFWHPTSHGTVDGYLDLH